MLCLLSPTKTLAEATCAAVASKALPSPVLSGPSDVLVARCQQLGRGDVKRLMGLSDNLAELNHTRFQGFRGQKRYPAADLFDGPSFKGLSVETMSQQERERLDKSLCILSGLYGFLRPTDEMQPYRLEMGTKLDVDGEPNLYKFWAKHGLTDTLAAEAKKNKVHTIINAASQEYAKVVDFELLREKHGLQVVEANFTAHSGRMAAVYAKQARGQLVRFVVKTKATSIKDLESFSGKDGHFKFNAAQSTPAKIVFERFTEPVTGGDEAFFGSSARAGHVESDEVTNESINPLKSEEDTKPTGNSSKSKNKQPRGTKRTLSSAVKTEKPNKQGKSSSEASDAESSAGGRRRSSRLSKNGK